MELYLSTEFLNIYKEKLDNRKTPIYYIFNKAVQIGVIKWYGPWRKYCFFPNDLTIWDSKCLTTILSVIDKIMIERKNNKDDNSSSNKD